MKSLFKTSLGTFPFYLIISLWLIHSVQHLLGEQWTWLGNHPLHWQEWYGIVSGALIHGDWQHLMNNSAPLVASAFFIYMLFGRFANLIFLSSYLLSGLLIFLFARQDTYHIGASGVVYSWISLLAASGLFRKDRRSLAFALLIAMFYGSMVWGVLPFQPGISWDGHLLGGLSGILLAYLFRNFNRSAEKIQENPSMEEAYKFDQFNYPFGYLKRLKKKKEEAEINSQNELT